LTIVVPLFLVLVGSHGAGIVFDRLANNTPLLPGAAQ